MELFRFLADLGPTEFKGSTHTHLFRLIQVMERSRSVSYIVDADCRFVYTNPAWDRFAKSNGAAQLKGETMIGTDLFKSIPDVLRAFYSDAFQLVLQQKQSIWDHVYECSSPTRFRAYRMRVHLMESRSWLLVTNTLVSERNHRKVVESDSDQYLTDGVIVMFAHCRCSMRKGRPDQW